MRNILKKAKQTWYSIVKLPAACIVLGVICRIWEMKRAEVDEMWGRGAIMGATEVMYEGQSGLVLQIGLD